MLVDRQHETAIPLAGSILSALSQSAAAQQSGCSGGTGHKGTAKQTGSPQRHQRLEQQERRIESVTESTGQLDDPWSGKPDQDEKRDKTEEGIRRKSVREGTSM